MSAVAFAEAGEFETARQMVRHQKTANKKVLLGTDVNEIDRQFLQYALQLCARLEAGLEIVHMVELEASSQKEEKNLRQMQQRLEEKNIVYQAVVPGSSLEEEVERYARGRGDILCVVLESARKEPGEARGCAGKKEHKFLKNLACPVVLFEPQAGF